MEFVIGTGMAARWSAAAFLEIEKSFRKLMGFRDLWALKAILDGKEANFVDREGPIKVEQ